MIASISLIPSITSTWAKDVHAELKQNRSQQQAIQKKQEKIQMELGSVSQQTQRLDQSLLRASSALKEVQSQLHKVDRVLRKLEDERADLAQNVDDLRADIANEATAAWMHAGRDPSWLDALAGVPVEEIPHRKHMIELLMAAHEEKKAALSAAVGHLDAIERKAKQRRLELATLKHERLGREQTLQQKRQDKRLLMLTLRKKKRHGDRRLRQLQAQEQSLKQLLVRLRTNLRPEVRNFSQQSVRAKKGRLPWPLSGRMVAAFGARQAIGSRLQGVQIAPRGGHIKVHAIAAGQVKFADWFGGYGLMLVVDHGDGVVAIYAHNDALFHQAGDWVEGGEIVSQAGTTGWVEKRRLYFELRDHGKPVDPRRWCKRR
ncbi:MAG: peptidoglycan DD-metalloendopeptidase family protein [Mariprofundales bacterium]